MRANTLRRRLGSGELSVNAWLSTDSAYLAEVFSYLGFDSVTVDLQHGMFGIDGAIRLLQAVSAGPSVPMARVGSADPAAIGKLLDAGAYGIICPDISTAAECAELVRACRYPPRGTRSFGPARGLLYGGGDYPRHADEEILVWAMIESVTAVTNLGSILDTPGLDAVFVGPNDLALSMGLVPGTGEIAGEVAGVMRQIASTAADRGVVAGAFCADGEQAAELAGWGYSLVTPGNDVSFVRSAAHQRLSAARATSSVPTMGSGY